MCTSTHFLQIPTLSIGKSPSSLHISGVQNKGIGYKTEALQICVTKTKKGTHKFPRSSLDSNNY